MRSTRPTRRKSRGTSRLLEALEARALLTSLPTGAVDTFSRTTIAGYAANKDDGQMAMTVEITVNGVKTTLTAEDYRGDVIKKLGSPYHGFSFTLPVLPAGKSSILVQAVSPTSGARRTLRNGTLTNPTPKAKIEVLTDTQLIGYAYDTDTASPIQVRVDVDGVQGTPFTTSIARPDLKGIGTTYTSPGFNVTGNFAGHVVEIYGLDNPTNTPVLLYTNNHKPIGRVEVNNGITLSGWALDPDKSVASIAVKVTVDGTVVAGSPFTASLERDDLIKKYNSSMHGFSIAMPALTPGTHTIAVYAVDGQAAACAPVLIGKAKVTNNPPKGRVDAVMNNGVVTGWALDKDLGIDAATVNLYVDDQYFATAQASLPRGDVGKPNHGFSFDISTLGTASHAITLTVIDNRSGDNEIVFYDGFLNNHRPVGKFESITNNTITGWAFDQDDPSLSDPVDVYIDGQYKTTIFADQPRTDVDAMFSTPNHAFSMALPALTFGKHAIALYAAESQQNVSVLIGSQTITIQRPVGKIESTAGNVLTGYAADPNLLGTSVQVKVYINGVLDPTLTTTANLDRPDLLAKKPFSSMPIFSSYGFSIALPSLNVGRNQIDVYVVDPTNDMLSPIGSTVITV